VAVQEGAGTLVHVGRFDLAELVSSGIERLSLTNALVTVSWFDRATRGPPDVRRSEPPAIAVIVVAGHDRMICF
jgi:hypothetical protein